MESIREILDPQIIENFQKNFQYGLNNYKLKNVLLDENTGKYKANCIHSSINWIRECVVYINKSKTLKGSNDLPDLLALFSLIHIIVEATDQIYRVLYNNTEGIGNNEPMSCFKNVPKDYKKLSDKKYFQELRAFFEAHPNNIESKNDGYKKIFADIPLPSTDIIEFIYGGEKEADFYIRIWTPTRKDKDTIYCFLYLNELEEFIKKRYNLLIDFSKKLKQIINKKNCKT